MNEKSYQLDHVGKAICVFGSARTNLDPKYYDIAYDVAHMAAGLGYATVTGAGPGIMEAANKGCHDANGHSVGIRIHLPFEQFTNKYCHEVHNFDKFYSRKCMLVRNSDVFIAMPGGMGTLDELFEVLTLIQCEKFEKPRKVILVGSEFWSGLKEWLLDKMVGVTISQSDLDLLHVVDTADEVIELL